jgi:hypothetical protein
MSFRRMRHVKAREFQGCALALDASVPSMYDATSGGSLVAADGGVARWEDQSGNSLHITQSTGANQPLRKVGTLNGGDGLLFDGTNDVLSRSGVATSSMYSGGTDSALFCVFVQDGTQTSNTLFWIGVSADRMVAHLTFENTLYFDAGSDSNGRISVAQPTGWDNNAHVVDGVRRGAYVRLCSDNVLRTSRANASGSVTSTTRNMLVGAQDGPVTYHKGTISEVAVIAATVSEILASRFRHSRMRKWRING